MFRLEPKARTRRTRGWIPLGAFLFVLSLLGSTTVARADRDDERKASEANKGLPSTNRDALDSARSSAVEEGVEHDLATRAAMNRALKFLASQQAGEADGSIPSVGTNSARLAVTALGALAYMAAGNLPSRGPQGRELTRALDYLLSRVDLDSTSRTRGYISDSGDKSSRMHGHGFATLALAEAYTMSPRSNRGARVAEALQAAVHLIENTQSVEGGWYYPPTRGLEHEGSITICLVQALRAAKGAGIRVDPDVIAKAVDYVRRSQTDNGGFRYSLGSGDVTVALTAAAISTLNATGKYHGPEIQQGFDYLQRELRARESAPEPRTKLGFRPTEGFPYYERLYLAQAFWQNPDSNVFDRWMAEEKLRILKAQNDNGSWGDPRYGDTYATAVNVLVLAIPDQLLPILQR